MATASLASLKGGSSAMLTWIREKFGAVVIGGIIAMIGFVFVVSGVFDFGSRKLGRGGAYAGTVNGDPIALAEFNRAYQRKIEFFQNLMGGNKLSEEQLKAFRLREGVFEELVRRKLMVQEAEKRGMIPAEAEIRQKISEIPAFQASGRFDVATYKQVLQANGYTPGSFERLMREDLSVQRWESFFRGRAHVSEAEIRKQYVASHDRRNIKYVLLTSEAGRRDVKIPDEEVSKYLADAAKLNVLKGQYEARKDTTYKGKSFDDVKGHLARDALASQKTDEIRRANEKIAGEVLGALTADKAGDARVNALLKPYGVEVKQTGMVTRSQPYLPGIGEAKELVTDAFAAKSPILASQGGKPKKYTSASWVLVALVTESESPDLTKLETDRTQIARTTAARKERELMDGWLKGLQESAKIDMNASVVSGAEG
jgi:hypothetical protein